MRKGGEMPIQKKVKSPDKKINFSKRDQLDSRRNEEVSKLAYQYYLERGCQDGYDIEDWLRAEKAVGNN